MSTKKYHSRRRFLQQFAAAAVLGTSASATHGKMQLLSSALNSGGQEFEEYRALVCVFLYGGSDSFNMYVPTDAAQYAEFASARPAELRTPLADVLSTNTNMGFSNYLPQMRSLFNSGDGAIVRNVGNLVEPTSRTELQQSSVQLPFGLFAHDHQQEQWQKGWSSQPATLVSTGWGGRIADMLLEANVGSAISPNISVGGSNFWIGGGQSNPVSVHPVNGLTRLSQYDPTVSAGNAQRQSTLNQLLALDTEHQMKQQVVSDFNRARESSGVVYNALLQSPDFVTPFNSTNSLATQLRMVARLIAARSAIGAQRQVFFVALGGWDTHNNQNVLLAENLGELDQALSSFHATINELNLGNQVTTFTASDFGRSLTINGDGTDHGWGGHSYVMGGAVNGSNLYGEMPSFELGGTSDAASDGRIIPTTSINQYGAALARWLGVGDTQLADIFPDLNNFGSDWDSQLGLFG